MDYKPKFIVIPGDVVSIDFNHYLDDTENRFKSGEVLKITERLEKCNNGTTKVNDLITIKYTDGQIGTFDAGFITGIISRPERKRVIQKKFMKGCGIAATIDKKGYFSLSDIIMVSMLIFRSNIDDSYHLDYSKLMNLFEKHRFPGLHSGKLVRIKIFKKWLLRNSDRIKRTRKEIMKENTQRNTEYENEYWEDCKKSLFS